LRLVRICSSVGIFMNGPALRPVSRRAQACEA
jgi:hypothetical protein